MNVNQLITAQRAASIPANQLLAIRSYQILTASILKRLVVHNHFNLSMALVCAGMDVECAQLETNVENLRMVMAEHEWQHGPPNHEIHKESLMERYGFFVQYATRWPSGADVRSGLNTIDLGMKSGRCYEIGWLYTG